MDTHTDNLLDMLRHFYEKIVMNIIHVYFEREVLNNNTSFHFLLHQHKHKLFHEYIPTVLCCQCQTTPHNRLPQRSGCLREHQFFVLYKCSIEASPNHEKKDDSKIKQYCICKFDPTDVKVFQLDIILLSAIINTCMKPTLPANYNPEWLRNIKGVRNFINHQGDASCLSKESFDDQWQILEQCSLSVANITGESYALGIKNRILSLKKESDVSFSLKEEIMNKLKNNSAVSEDTIGQITVQLDQIIFMLKNINIQISPKAAENLEDGIDISDKDKTCFVRWTLSTPSCWTVDEIKHKLKSVTELSDFRIQFVYTGSLVIETTISKKIVCNADALAVDILSFLETFCKATDINTKIDTLVDVEIFVTDVTLIEIPGTEKTGSSAGNCYTCYNRNVVNEAYEWCINCQELYCNICTSIHRATTCLATHTFISVNSTSKHFPPNIHFKTECKKHSQNLDFYCNNHGKIVCIDCVRLSHLKCVDIVSVEKASLNIKSSFRLTYIDTVIRRLESVIDDFLSGLLHHERESNITKPDLEAKILDVFQKSVSMEEAEVKVKPLTDLIFINDLTENAYIKLTKIRNKVAEINGNIYRIKKYCTESQTFIGIHKLNKDIAEVEKIFKAIFGQLSKHNLLLRLIEKYELQYSIKRYETLQSKPIDQSGAQVHVSDIEHIGMSQTTSFVMNEIDLNASARLTVLGERILIVHKNKIIVQNISGYFDHDIILPGIASDIAVINDENVVVLLQNSIEQVNIIDKHIATVRKDPSEKYRALSFCGKHLFVLGNFVVHMMDLSGNIIKSHSNTETYQDNNYDPCIVAYDEKLFILSCSVESHLQCFDLNGKRLWHSIFKDMNLGVQMTIDNKGNLFIPCYYDGSIRVLNIGDRFCKVMLTETAEFKSPRALYFDQGHSRIVALHGSHMCTVFDISSRYM